MRELAKIGARDIFIRPKLTGIQHSQLLGAKANKQ